ncbi:hypothetical protein [Sphingobium yanoikuyae]|uniref:hypothetical protein n=1 Tax=Sphingobium yanoikuyae TaxID=13690 RepID=UPI0035C8520A
MEPAIVAEGGWNIRSTDFARHLAMPGMRLGQRADQFWQRIPKHLSFQPPVPATCHGQRDRIDQVDAKIGAAQDQSLGHAHGQFAQSIRILVELVLAGQRLEPVQPHEHMGFAAMMGYQQGVSRADLAPMGKVADQFRSGDTPVAYVVRHG